MMSFVYEFTIYLDSSHQGHDIMESIEYVVANSPNIKLEGVLFDNGLSNVVSLATTTPDQTYDMFPVREINVEIVTLHHDDIDTFLNRFERHYIITSSRKCPTIVVNSDGTYQ